MIVGRAAEADIVLNHPEISRRHCQLTLETSSWVIEDLGSQRGTIVNNVRISDKTPLNLGDQIVLGPVTLGFGHQSQSVAADPKVNEPLGVPGTIIFRKRVVQSVPLSDRLVFGRSPDVDVQLNDPIVSRRHAEIEEGSNGFRVVDLHSRAGSFVNGRRFDEHQLVIGDQLQLGPFYFAFTGNELQRIQRVAAGKMIAVNLSRKAGSSFILQDASLVVEPGQFIGILGPSGSGKSTLLNALSGLRPADTGRVLVDDTDFYSNLNQLRQLFGYVPQDDIVHGELTVREALTFSARLRLPAGTPAREIETLVKQMMNNLGLAERENLRIALLSGGQRKRVSVGVELLRRPPLIFLDEPTSGLDPFAEFKLMELLRRLADTGCTVICTTHVMENVYLMDQIAVISAGRVVFQGPPESARTRFGVTRLSGLYDALQTIEPKLLRSVPPPALPEQSETVAKKIPPSKGKQAFALPILLQRQFTIFRSDLKNLAIAIGQPLIIGLLVCWVSSNEPLTQFFAYIATLWFGCSNSAQEIVKEVPIYRRERLVGLSRWSYLLSKFLWMGTLTNLQSLILFACIVAFGHAWPPAIGWQVISLFLLGYAATGIGLTVSAVARSPLQAVMLVPLILIPQILLSGYTVRTNQMSEPVLLISKIMPSFAAQRISDAGALLYRPLTGELTDVDHYYISLMNMNQWQRDHGGARLTTQNPLVNPSPIFVGYISLIVWTIAGFFASYLALARKERD
jgi:ABC-type multidrug transport system ATPase subunit/pSer/pThr/pTyr-binding forkhead associated (FHA) protein